MSTIKIEGSIALVTGGNRGIGRAVVDELLKRGASKVYVGARNTDSVSELAAAFPNRVHVLELDVTNQGHIDQAAAVATDVNILVNNAGVANNFGKLITDATTNAEARIEFEVNVFGLVAVTQAFAPILQTNGGGAIINLGSVASFVNFPMFQSYSASKAAVHSITQATRISLPETLVVGVYPGPIDTDMAKDLPMDKVSPTTAANEILDGIETGAEEVLTDPMAKQLGGLFFTSPKELEKQVAAMAEPAE